MLKTVTLTAENCQEERGFYDSICTVEIDKDVCQVYFTKKRF